MSLHTEGGDGENLSSSVGSNQGGGDHAGGEAAEEEQHQSIFLDPAKRDTLFLVFLLCFR